MSPEEEAQILIPMLMMLVSVQRYNDLLEGTPFYKQNLKQCSKRLGTELERVIESDLGPLLTDQVPGLPSVDIIQAMNAQDGVISAIVKLRAYEYIDAKKLIDAYIENRRSAENLKIIDYWKLRAEAAEELLAAISENVAWTNQAAGAIGEKRAVWESTKKLDE